MQGNQVTTHLPFERINIPVDLGGTNLPMVHHSFMTEHQKRESVPQMRLALVYPRLSKLGVFGDISSIRYLQNMDIFSEQM